MSAQVELWLRETHPTFGDTGDKLCVIGPMESVHDWLSNHLLETATDEYRGKVMTWLEWESATSTELEMTNGRGTDHWRIVY